jgi:hypothetical protein
MRSGLPNHARSLSDADFSRAKRVRFGGTSKRMRQLRSMSSAARGQHGTEGEIQKKTQAAPCDASRHRQPEEPPSREPVCADGPYPRYEPGIYDAECVSAKVYFHPILRAWKCQLDFQILPNGEPICGFLHLGNKEWSSAGPNSEYRRAWIIAAGQAPRKRQTMTCRVYKGKIFEVRIGDTCRRFDGRSHPEPAVYSTVKEILRRTYP